MKLNKKLLESLIQEVIEESNTVVGQELTLEMSQRTDLRDYIKENPGLSVQELASNLGLNVNSVRGAVGQLKRAGEIDASDVKGRAPKAGGTPTPTPTPKTKPVTKKKVTPPPPPPEVIEPEKTPLSNEERLARNARNKMIRQANTKGFDMSLSTPKNMDPIKFARVLDMSRSELSDWWEEAIRDFIQLKNIKGINRIRNNGYGVTVDGKGWAAKEKLKKQATPDYNDNGLIWSMLRKQETIKRKEWIRAKKQAKKMKKYPIYKDTIESVVGNHVRGVRGDELDIWDDGFAVYDVDRGPRTDHGGGEDGDGWMSWDEQESIFEPYMREWKPKAKAIAKELTSKGIPTKGDAEWGEKGHIRLIFDKMK